MFKLSRIFLLLVVLSCSFAGFAESWQDLIPNLTESDLGKINAGKYCDRPRAYYRYGFELMPTGLDINDVLLAEIEEFDPELCVEMLFILDKPDVPEEDLMLYILNNFRAFSDQTGLEYYSSNRKAMYTLFNKSYFVNDKKKKIADPVATSMPEYEVHKYFQDDTTFGGNYYTLTTRSSQEYIWFQMENTTTMRVKGLIKAVDKGGERVNFIARPVGDKLVFYVLVQIKEEPQIKQVFKWKVNVPGSFKRRMSTIVDWFKARAY